MSLRFLTALVLSFAFLAAPPVASAEVRTFTATHAYTLGDHDSKDDARQRCLLEAKRKILEQAGVYIESASEVKDLQLTKDTITSFAAAVMHVKDTKEEVGFQQGHMTLTLTLKADVDLAEIRKRLAARQVDAGIRDDVAAQKERLKRLEAQLEAMQNQQQGGQSSGHASDSPPIDISAEDLQALHTQAAQGDAEAQIRLGRMYRHGLGVPQDFQEAVKWYRKAADQGNAEAQFRLGMLYEFGRGVPRDFVQAAKWYEKAAAQGNAKALNRIGRMYAQGEGVPRDSVQAVKWYEKAAAQGDAEGQLAMGVAYENGVGVPRDYVRAYMWFNLAAAREKDDAQKFFIVNRDRVTLLMTPAQIAEAKRLTQQCQAQQFKGC